MSPAVIMWAASIFGAALFFAAGYLLAGRPEESDPTGEVVVRDTGAEQALAATRQELELANGERQTFKSQVGELESKLDVKNGQIGELERQLFDAQQQLETQTATAQRLEQELSEMRDEQDANQTKIKGPIDDFDDQATHIRDSRAGSEVGSLMGENIPDDNSIAALLQALQAQVAEDPTWLSAALADDLGMSVVGAGEHSEALAVFSSFIKQLQKRTQTLLPLDALRRFTLEDVEGHVVSSCTLRDQSLSLVTLTRHATPSTAALTDLLESTTGRL